MLPLPTVQSEPTYAELPAYRRCARLVALERMLLFHGNCGQGGCLQSPI